LAGLSAQRRICDTEFVFCLPGGHIAVMARRASAGLFNQPEEQEELE
jgi:hypothetical protein